MAESVGLRRIWFMAGILVAAVVAVYANSLNAPFVFDDLPGIVDNPTIRDLGDLGAVLGGPNESGSSANSRPLFNLSLALNYAAGGLEPFGYHLVNGVLHALSALLLFGFVRRTCRLGRVRDRTGTIADPIAFGTALLWAVHPLQTETVTCSIQRTEGLAGLWFLMACYGFVRSLESRGRGWSLLTVAACLAGVLSKELVAVAPLVLVVYDRTFAAGTFAEAWRRRRGLYLAMLATWVPLAWLVVRGGGRAGTAGTAADLGVWEYLLTQCRALVTYLKLSVWPHPLVLDYGSDFDGTLGDVWWQAVVIVALLGLTGWALARRPVLGFFGAWFFLILAPSSSFVPLQTQTMAEHRMYLPLAALTAGVAIAVAMWRSRQTQVIVAAVAVALGATSVARNRVYGSTLGIWQDTHAKAPGNPRAATNLFLELMAAGRFEESLELGQSVVATHPDNSTLRVNLATVFGRAGRPADAAGQLNEAIRLDPQNAEAHFNLGNLMAQLGRFQDAARHFADAVRVKPGHVAARLNLGRALTSLGQLPAALDQFREARRLDPQNPEAAFALGNVLAEMNQMADAIAAWEEALRLAPGHPGATANLARARRN